MWWEWSVWWWGKRAPVEVRRYAVALHEYVRDIVNKIRGVARAAARDDGVLSILEYIEHRREMMEVDCTILLRAVQMAAQLVGEPVEPNLYSIALGGAAYGHECKGNAQGYQSRAVVLSPLRVVLECIVVDGRYQKRGDACNGGHLRDTALSRDMMKMYGGCLLTRKDG